MSVRAALDLPNRAHAFSAALFEELARAGVRHVCVCPGSRSTPLVAAAVGQGRADWGVTIEPVARAARLHFRPLRAEHYDFAVPESRWERPAVRALRRLLEPGSGLRARLEELGFGDEEEA